MARLALSYKYGSTTPSSLLKSATTMQKTIANNQDAAYRDAWSMSGYTNEAFQQYSTYLSSRINKLKDSSNPIDLAKATSLNKELISANHNNMSYQIQQENLSLMMQGESTSSNGYMDKMNLTQGLYNRAVAIGDNTLALQLQNQYASYSQSYQTALQTEYKAQTDLQNSISSSVSSQSTSIASAATEQRKAFETGIKNFFDVLRAGTVNQVTDAMKSYYQEIAPQYKQVLGVDLPKDAQITPGALLKAYFELRAGFDKNVATALASSDPTKAAEFAVFSPQGNVIGGDAFNIIANVHSIDVPGLGQRNYADARELAANPGSVSIGTNSNTGKTELFSNPKGDMYMAPNGDIYHSVTGQTGKPELSKNQQNQVTKLLINAGFGNVQYKNGTFTATTTDKTDKWTQYNNRQLDLAGSPGIGQGTRLEFTLNSKGQLEAKSDTGRLLTVSFDNKGLAGIAATYRDGNNIVTHQIAGQYGFNAQGIQKLGVPGPSMISKVAKFEKGVITQAPTYIGGILGGPLGLIAGRQITQNIQQMFAPQPQPHYQMTQRAGGGFNFTKDGQAISAATYASGTRTAFRSLLQDMANKGDGGARAALGFVGNDYGYDPSKIGSNAGVYNALTWGEHAPAHVNLVGGNANAASILGIR